MQGVGRNIKIHPESLLSGSYLVGVFSVIFQILIRLVVSVADLTDIHRLRCGGGNCPVLVLRMKLITVNVEGKPQLFLSEWQLVLVSPVVPEVSVTLVISTANLTDVNRVLSSKRGECSSFRVEVIRGYVSLEN